MKCKKKVLIWEVLPFIGGGQKVSLQVGLALTKTNKYEVEFLVPAEGALTETLKQHGIAYHYSPMETYSLMNKRFMDYLQYFLDGITTIPRFLNLQKKGRFDLLYIGGARAFLWGTLLGQLFSLSVIWHIHNIFADRKIVWLLMKFGELSAVKKILCVSESVKKQYPSLEHKIEVLYNGIDQAQFQVSCMNNLLSELGIPKGAVVLTSIATLQPVKRQDLLIKALPEVLKTLPGVYVLLVGPRREESISYAVYLEKLAEDFGIKERVLFLGRRDDIPTILKNTSITVVTGEEGFSLVGLESCAAGVPVISPDVAGAGEIIRLSLAGEVFRHGDAADLAKVLTCLLRDDVSRKRYSLNGIAFARQHSLEAFGEKICNVANRTLGEVGDT